MKQKFRVIALAVPILTVLSCAPDPEPRPSATEAYSAIKERLLEPQEASQKVAVLESFVDEYPDHEETVKALRSLVWNLRNKIADPARARAVIERSLERTQDPEHRFEIALMLHDVSTEVGEPVDLRGIADALAAYRALGYVDYMDLVTLAAAAEQWQHVLDLAVAMQDLSTEATFRGDYPDQEFSDEEAEVSAGRRLALSLAYSGGALMNLGRADEATLAFERSALSTPVNYAGVSDSPLYLYWAQNELDLGRAERAAELAAPEAIMGENEKAGELLRAAYLALGGAEDGFEAYRWEMREKLARTVEDFTLEDYSGNSVSLSELRDKVVLISFWNPACPPCRIELPSLQKLWEKYRDEGFEVVAIESYAETEKATKIIAELGLSFTCLENGSGDSDVVWNQFGVSAYPTSMMLDRQGRLIYYHLGFDAGDEEQTEAELLTLL